MRDFIIEAPDRPGHLDREATLIIQALSHLGKSWSFMPRRRLTNRSIALDPAVPASGTIPFVRAAFRCAGFLMPEDHSYPEELRHYLARDIRETTLKKALLQRRPVFIKPSRRTKRFTGFVYLGESPTDILGVPPSEPVWVSDPIDIQSEWRTYCAGKEALHTSWCSGDRQARPDPAVIREMCSLLSDEAPYAHGCAIDTAVTATGQTILLELNDGYSIGAYDDVPAMAYYSVIASRWAGSPTA